MMPMTINLSTMNRCSPCRSPRPHPHAGDVLSTRWILEAIRQVAAPYSLTLSLARSLPRSLSLSLSLSRSRSLVHSLSFSCFLSSANVSMPQTYVLDCAQELAVPTTRSKSRTKDEIDLWLCASVPSCTPQKKALTYTGSSGAGVYQGLMILGNLRKAPLTILAPKPPDTK